MLETDFGELEDGESALTARAEREENGEDFGCEGNLRGRGRCSGDDSVSDRERRCKQVEDKCQRVLGTKGDSRRTLCTAMRRYSSPMIITATGTELQSMYLRFRKSHELHARTREDWRSHLRDDNRQPSLRRRQNRRNDSACSARDVRRDDREKPCRRDRVECGGVLVAGEDEEAGAERDVSAKASQSNERDTHGMPIAMMTEIAASTHHNDQASQIHL